MLTRIGWRAAAVVGLVGTAMAAGMDTSHLPEGEFDGERLVIHEWGTFTSLQDEDGEAIGGVNADDEPAPGFVHRIADSLVLGPGAAVPILRKSVPRSHPDATMRLETPVIYFYPPRGAETPLSLDVEVSFRGGWLSEYYPDAEVEAPGVGKGMKFGPITEATVGRLRWKNLQVGVEGEGPATDSEVWLAPRRVPAATVRTEAGETERFLFYRGLGRVESPLAVSRDESGKQLVVKENFPDGGRRGAAEVVVRRMWLVDIRKDKSCAFRELQGFHAKLDGTSQEVAATAAEFAESNFASGNIDALSASMWEALVEDGLYPAEAEALLATWRSSYFESAGLRLFYLLPRQWIDEALPLSAAEADVVRTMVGRVEIVTPEERRLLGEIAAGPASDAKWLRADPTKGVMPAEAPADFAAYEQLGRFRNALVLDELARRPTAALEAFIKNYGLAGYRPVEVEVAAGGGE